MDLTFIIKYTSQTLIIAVSSNINKQYPTRHKINNLGHSITEVMNMSYISSAVQPKFNELSENLRNQILSRDVQLRTIYDLIHVLEEIVNEEEAKSPS